MSKAYRRVVDAAYEKGRAVKEFNDRALIQCPAHDDGRPSLSVKPIEGSALVYCFAGCDTKDVVEALGLSMGDLFDDEKGATYLYPGGREVRRTPDKQFWQSGNKADTSLFRADRISGDSPVFVVEGEKDVLAIESAGGQAVSTPLGASTKPERFDWEPLRGKAVRVIADRDDAGRNRAHAVAEYLTPIAGSVVIYEPVEGKDAADHIASDHTLDQFKPIVSPDILTLSEAFDAWREWRDSEGFEPIPTPWPSLNNKLAGGLHPGRLYVIGARTGQGKSVLGQNIVTYAALQKFPSLVVSVEMPVTEVVSRIIASEAGIDYSSITKRDFSEEFSRIDEFIQRYRCTPMFICDNPTVTIEQVGARCRGLRNAVGLRALFLDYAQLVTPTDRKVSRQEQVAHITREAKLLAMDLDLAVVVAAQLNRNAETDIPKISDLRESGELEQSADVILLLHQIENSPNLDLNIAKNRTGPPGSITLTRRFDQARLDAS